LLSELAVDLFPSANVPDPGLDGGSGGLADVNPRIARGAPDASLDIWACCARLKRFTPESADVGGPRNRKPEDDGAPGKASSFDEPLLPLANKGTPLLFALPNIPTLEDVDAAAKRALSAAA
jgi:hypothetical protein